MASSDALIAVGAQSSMQRTYSSSHSEQVGMIGIRLQLNRCGRKYLIRTYSSNTQCLYGIWIWILVPNPGPSYFLLLLFTHIVSFFIRDCFDSVIFAAGPQDDTNDLFACHKTSEINHYNIEDSDNGDKYILIGVMTKFARWRVHVPCMNY